MNTEKTNVNVVLDTNVFISSVFWRGNPHKIVDLALDKKIHVYVSPEILTEFEEVLQRKFQESKQFIEEQIALILEYSTIVRPTTKIEIVKNDPDDNKIIECAITAKADYIISGDPDLTNLKQTHGITILTPKEFLQILAKKP